MPQKIYLIPTTISENETLATLSSDIAKIAGELRFFLVEQEKSARQFLRKLNPAFPLAECKLFLLNEHTSATTISEYLEQCAGRDIGILAEAGVPCVADPGADIVLLAHKRNIEVVPLAGPSSILLGLMASGLNGQNFAFNGYLPKDKNERIRKIKALEERSFRENQTQIFMETPYHSQDILSDIIASCREETLLCVACQLTSPTQQIKTRPIREWKKNTPQINKQPAVFLLQRRA